MRRILAIRPEPGLSSTLAAGREMGLAITGTPLFEIRPVEWILPAPFRSDAVRHGGVNLEKLRGKPAYVVGKATEKAARDFGFEIASVGSGGLQTVLDAIEPPANLLRIAGAEHVELMVPENISIETAIAYESVALPIDPAHLGDIGDQPIVLLHSAAAARHFAGECKRLSIDTSAVEIAALGPRIASAAGKDWRAIHVADHPNDAALLAMVRSLCQ